MITFVRTRYFYPSYTDFWKLVELSGFDTCYVDEMEIGDSEKTYVVSPINGELSDYMGQRMDVGRSARGARLLAWNLERPSNGVEQYINDNQRLLDLRLADGILVSDRELARQTGFDYIPLGVHPGLGTPGKFEDKRYDLIHLSCYSNHRSWLFTAPDRPKASYNGMSIAPNGWSESRDNALKQSRFMLNVHQDGMPYIEPLRFALAAAYGLPIISEYSIDFYPYAAIIPLEQLVPAVRGYSSERYWYYQSVYSNLKLDFRMGVEACLE